MAAVAVALCGLVFSSLPVVASATSNPTNAQYKSPPTQVSQEVSGGPAGLQDEVVSGLPFTGLDAIALVAVGVALTSLGFALRRLTADRGQAP